MTKAVGTWLFWTRGESLLSSLIRRVTGPWSHMGIGFDLEDGAPVYYESLFRDGFTGPKPWCKVVDWAAKHPKRKWARRSLDLSPEISERKRVLAQAHVGRLGYAAWQLLGMWWFERVGKRYGWHLRRSPKRAVCSEAVARILWPEMNLLNHPRRRFDEVTPSSAWRKLCRIEEAAGRAGLNGYPANAVNNALNRARIDRKPQGVSTPAPGGDRQNARNAQGFAQGLENSSRRETA